MATQLSSPATTTWPSWCTPRPWSTRRSTWSSEKGRQWPWRQQTGFWSRSPFTQRSWHDGWLGCCLTERSRVRPQQQPVISQTNNSFSALTGNGLGSLQHCYCVFMWSRAALKSSVHFLLLKLDSRPLSFFLESPCRQNSFGQRCRNSCCSENFQKWLNATFPGLAQLAAVGAHEHSIGQKNGPPVHERPL